MTSNDADRSSERNQPESEESPAGLPRRQEPQTRKTSGAVQRPSETSDERDAAKAVLRAEEFTVDIDLDQTTIGEAASSLLRVFNYSASLPERTLRSATAIAGGFVRESASWLIPSAFRNSRSYSLFVQQMLDFVVNDIGGVKRVSIIGKSAAATAEVDLARKTVGNLLDMAAFATFHISPITVLAIFSDVAYGSKVYLRQLSTRLKEQGIVNPETTIDSAGDLIEALEAASGEAVGAFDQPPISVDGLRKTLLQTQQAVAKVDPRKLFPASEIDQLWRQMELAAVDQHASLWDVSTTISMVALNNIQAAGQGALVSLEIAGDIFHEQIIGHYWEGLRAIERKGLIPTLSESSQPYLEAVWTNFSIDQKTWTEQLLSGELLKWGWSRLSWPKLSRDSREADG